jgi:hypothetical protein
VTFDERRIHVSYEEEEDACVNVSSTGTPISCTDTVHTKHPCDATR